MKRLAYLIAGAVLLAASSTGLAKTEVFTVAGQPVTHVPDGVTVVELDKPSRLDKQLSDGLPSDKADAAKRVKARMATMTPDFGRAYQGLIRAFSLGVAKVPAVVVDGQYVVYGQPNVSAAIQEINRERD